MPDYHTYKVGPPSMYTVIHTEGRTPPMRMLEDERFTKKRLSNPILWAQIEAISRGTYVNHLGKGHARIHPPSTSENEWERRVKNAHEKCNACIYGNTAVYLHRSDCNYKPHPDSKNYSV